MAPFQPSPTATKQTKPPMMVVKWYSGVERLDMHEIAKALDTYTTGAIITVPTTELRSKEFREVLYEPSIAPLGPDAFTLTYTDGGVWLDETDDLTSAEGDHGTAEFQKTVDSEGTTTWTCKWESSVMPTVRAAPICTLSDEITTREYREHKVAVRDSKFRRLIFRETPKCLITGEEAKTVLDAAHIYEVRHGGKDELGNGIVLRTDLHKLFDENILKLDINGSFRMEPMLESYKEWFKDPKSIPRDKVKFYAENIGERNAAKERKDNTANQK